MTREEALQHFKEQLDIFGGEHAEAIKVAIEALQKPPISQRSMYQAGYRQGREETLKQVTGKLNNSDDSLLTADSEACKEQKSKLDLISRQAAIDALYDKGSSMTAWGELLAMKWSDIQKCIEQLPSADRPRGEWIPVSERLPSEKKAVLICDSGGIRFVGKLVLTDYGYKWGVPLCVVWVDIEDSDAWMPLPEPYKGGEDE